MLRQTSHGFTLVEMLVAMLLASALCLALVGLFHQSERVFRDQDILVEMQQSARAALALITDDLRLAGQGVPVYAAAMHESLSEGAVVILEGSTASRIQFRAGYTDLDSFVESPSPAILAIGTPADLQTPDASAYSGFLGTTPQGRFVYVWDIRSGWVRAQIRSISGLTKILGVTPVEASAPVVQFDAKPLLSLEEAIVIFHDTQTKSIRRAVAANLANPMAPVWTPANEIAAHVVGLEFRYFDGKGTLLPDLTTLAQRHSVARIDVEVSVRAASPLSNGSQPVFSLSQRTYPANLDVR